MKEINLPLHLDVTEHDVTIQIRDAVWRVSKGPVPPYVRVERNDMVIAVRTPSVTSPFDAAVKLILKEIEETAEDFRKTVEKTIGRIVSGFQVVPDEEEPSLVGCGCYWLRDGDAVLGGSEAAT